MNLRRSLLSALLLSTSLIPAAALAQVSDGDKAAARQLTLAGYEALDKKDYAGAVDRFKRAESLFHAPTMTLGFARAQVGLGKLVSAQEAYSRLVHETLPAGAPAAFMQAIDDGCAELAALTPRIPAVVIQVRGTDAPRVTIDGVEVPSAVLGVSRPVDPGKHLIRATAAGATTSEITVTSTEGKTETVNLVLAPSGVAPPPPPPTPPPAAGPPAQLVPAPAPLPSPPPRDEGGSGSPRKAIGFAALGVGAAGLVVGGVMAGLASAKHADLLKACPTGHCAPHLEQTLGGDVSTYNTLGAASTAGFIAGGALAATGLILVLTAPKAPPRAAASISPIVGPGLVGLKGTF